jgi:hypothetical protein
VLFTDFLKATVLLSAGAATALAAVTLAAAGADGEDVVVYIAAGWWVAAGVVGALLGRRTQASAAIARLLATARPQPTLPELQPGRVLLNRLWPLALSTLSAGALAFLAAQIPAIATGFAIIWALAWRRQEAAVAAVEERDGVRFYVERSSPVGEIRLVRTPGFGGRFLAVQPPPGATGTDP